MARATDGCAFRFSNCATTFPRISEHSSACGPSSCVQRLPMAESRLHMLQPAVRLGQFLQPLPVQRRLHRSAIRVPAQNHVLHLQHIHRVLDRRRHAVHIVHRNRHHVPDAAADKQIARPGAQNQIRHNARIRTGNEQPLRRLRLRQQMKLVLPLRGNTSARNFLCPSINRCISTSHKPALHIRTSLPHRLC